MASDNKANDKKEAAEKTDVNNDARKKASADNNESTDELSNEAKRLKSLGVDLEQEQETGPGKPKTFRDKVSNYWYHNKWTTIIVVLFVFFAVVATAQLIGRESPDVYVIYAGPCYINADANLSVRQAIKACMTEDYNGDGKLGVVFTDITYMNTQQLEQVAAEAKAQGVNIALDLEGNRNAYQKFNNEIFAGDSIICFLDAGLYQTLVEAGGLLSAADIWPDGVPDDALEAAVDETGALIGGGADPSKVYGFQYSALAFGQYYGSATGLPGDTVVCIRRVSTMSFFKGKAKTEKVHEYHVGVFKNIIDFTPPDTETTTAE